MHRGCSATFAVFVGMTRIYHSRAEVEVWILIQLKRRWYQRSHASTAWAAQSGRADSRLLSLILSTSKEINYIQHASVFVGASPVAMTGNPCVQPHRRMCSIIVKAVLHIMNDHSACIVACYLVRAYHAVCLASRCQAYVAVFLRKT